MSLYESWLDFREKCLTSKRFHDFAIRFPLTRPVVRKRQSELFDLVSGFVYSQILASCVELNIFSHVAGKGRTIASLAGTLKLPEDETRRLLDGAVSLRLLEKIEDRYRLGDLGAALSINKGVLAMIRHHGALYKDLTDPVELLRGGRRETNLSRYWDYAMSEDPVRSDDADVAPYSELMSESQIMVAEEIAACFHFADYETLLDVGGGQGTFLRTIAPHAEHLDLMLFDLPAVAARAEKQFADAGFGDRIVCHGGSFFDDPLPVGADLVSLVRIVHDHDDEPAQKIVQAVYDCLPKGGTLILCEPMSTGGSAHRIADAYFNFYLYAMGSGRPRSPQMLTNMLESCGFSSVRLVPTRAPLITSILCAQK
ncbi:methyltransferase [Pseudahrensia aquimaris]|uniref:Methyltransferase n=1 Tax=Pseudahrensia aquimaris TaxID=744461 RepID=A0ABW3FJ34_9HYPH